MNTLENPLVEKKEYKTKLVQALPREICFETKVEYTDPELVLE